MAKRIKLPAGTDMQPILRRMEEERQAFWRSLTKQEWIAAARSQFNTGEPDQCCICGQSSSISQAHHIIPLGEQYDRGSLTPNHADHVWLCPNHHAIVHLFMRYLDFRALNVSSLKQTYGLNDAQIEHFAKLMQQAKEWQPWQRR